MTPKLYTAAPLQPLLPSCTVPAPASRRQTPQPAAQMLCLGTQPTVRMVLISLLITSTLYPALPRCTANCQDGNGCSAHDADSVHSRSSATSAAFLQSFSASQTSPDTAATCTGALPQYTAYCQDGNGCSAHDADSVHCRSSATSAAFLHSSSARLTSPDTAASCTDALPRYAANCQDGSGFLAHDADSVCCSTLIHSQLSGRS